MAMAMAVESEEEEHAFLLNTTKVVEYLAPFMSVELLCKFPDNSAYDFDYSQSTIWSPLVPRPYTPMDLNLITPTNLSHEYDHTPLGARSSAKKLKKKKKLTSTPFNLKHEFTKKKLKKLPSDFSPRFKAPCNPILNKRWGRVLKAASKQFKRWKVKRDPIAHVMLPNSFKYASF